MFKFELGVIGESKISGFTGMITSRAQHLNGCDRYYVEPKVDKDGKLRDGAWMDEAEIEIIPSETKIERQNNDRGGFASSIK